MVLMFPYLTNAITISIMGRLTSVYPFRQDMSVKYGIAVNSFEMLEKSIKNFDWRKTLESLSIRFKFDLLNETLKIFGNYIPNEKKEMRLLPISMNDW